MEPTASNNLPQNNQYNQPHFTESTSEQAAPEAHVQPEAHIQSGEQVQPVFQEAVSPLASPAVTSSTPSYPSTAASSPMPPPPVPGGSQYFNNSIFWIETEKIVPNPYQPRREFDQHALKDLSESIRMYGLLQPLVVTRREFFKDDGGLAVQYELISGERRLRASKLAGLIQVPVIIRAGEEDARVKLELAIIENLQREDLNAVDRARSFQRLADEFGLKHTQIAEKMGKSREYVTNSIRLLSLPDHMLTALSEKRITEGHTRPLLMLVDRPEEQETLFKEIVFKKITVREAEQIARRVAVDRVRKKDVGADPEIREFETKLNQALGTRVLIEKREQGGKIVIDFFNNDDLRHLLDMVENREIRSTAGAHLGNAATGSVASVNEAHNAAAIITASDSPARPAPVFTQMPEYIPQAASVAAELSGLAQVADSAFGDTSYIKPYPSEIEPSAVEDAAGMSGAVMDAAGSFNASVELEPSAEELASPVPETEPITAEIPVDDSTPTDAREDEDLYSIKNFSI